MGIELRRGAPDDSVKCGRICFDAFKSLAETARLPARLSFTRDCVRAPVDAPPASRLLCGSCPW
jgi:hypothetical protein